MGFKEFDRAERGKTILKENVEGKWQALPGRTRKNGEKKGREQILHQQMGVRKAKSTNTEKTEPSTRKRHYEDPP